MSAVETSPGVQVIELPVSDLSIGDDFRLDDDPEALGELAASIGQIGVLQPLLVRQTGAGWEVVAGRRRLAAARTAGLSVVPCIIRALTDEEAADRALAENMHRRDLSPVEIGLAYANLRARGHNQRQIAERVGRSPAQVGFLLAVLELPPATRDKVHRRQLSYMTALYPHAKTGKRQGGKGGNGPSGHDESKIVSHWRRRHDRVVAGIQAVLASEVRDGGGFAVTPRAAPQTRPETARRAPGRQAPAGLA